MIRDQPDSERPRERCLRGTAQQLSLRECLAILLGSGPKGKGCMGLAEDILRKMGSYPEEGDHEAARRFFGVMERGQKSALSDVSGLGQAGLARLLSAFELARRYFEYRSSESTGETKTLKIIERLALEQITLTARCQAEEWIGFIPVYRSGKVGRLCRAAAGNKDSVTLSSCDFFALILPLRPAAAYLVHNHPSGILHPSPEDMQLTSDVRNLFAQFGIEFLGHWIVGPEGIERINLQSIDDL